MKRKKGRGPKEEKKREKGGGNGCRMLGKCLIATGSLRVNSGADLELDLGVGGLSTLDFVCGTARIPKDTAADGASKFSRDEMWPFAIRLEFSSLLQASEMFARNKHTINN
jgi:hypothetical protein